MLRSIRGCRARGRTFATTAAKKPASRGSFRAIRWVSAGALLGATAYTTAGLYALRDASARSLWIENMPGGEPALEKIAQLEATARQTSLEDVKKKATEYKESAEHVVSDVQGSVQEGITKLQKIKSDAEVAIKSATETATDVYAKTKSQIDNASETANKTYHQVAEQVHTTSNMVFENIEWLKTTIMGVPSSESKSSPPFTKEKEEIVPDAKKAVAVKEEKPKPIPSSASQVPVSSPPTPKMEKTFKKVPEKVQPVVVNEPAPKVIPEPAAVAVPEQDSVKPIEPPKPAETAKDSVPEEKPLKKPAAKAVEKVVKAPVEKEVKKPTPAIPAAVETKPIEVLKKEDIDKISGLLRQLSASALDESLRGEILTAVDSFEKDASGKNFHVSSIIDLFEKVTKGFASLNRPETIEEAAKLKTEVDRLTSALLDTTTFYIEELASKEKDMQESFLKEYEALQQKLVEEFNSELSRETAAFKESKRVELEEKISSLQRHWEEQIKFAVDSERDGRLARLDHLSAQLKFLQNLCIDAGDFLFESRRVLVTQTALNLLNARLSGHFRSPLSKEIEILKTVGNGDPFVSEILGSLSPEIASGGVATVTELSNSFRTVASSIRQVQLMPDFGGPLSYSVSRILSPLIMRKSGLVAGDDVESVLSRTQYYLEQGDLESSARELNQLKGWPKKIASDWLIQARLHLEVKQAYEVIDCHLKLSALASV
ncbi:Formation of crista junctions protein 1 [Dinochytrium kinnereticum]|nr:Formation of crista junctions protein 1 [Dinochytrium kinnereticum]